MLRVDILDSSPVFLIGVEHLFADAGFKVTGTRTSSAAQPSWCADVFMVDPAAVVGRCAAEFISESSKLSPVLVTVSGEEEQSALSGFLQAGASGLVNRNSKPEVLVSAVKAVASGVSFLCEPLAEQVPEDLPEPAPGPAALSPRERQVLSQIAHGRTHSQVARALGISRHTVDTYVKRVRSKIDVGNKAELTRAAILGHLGI
jgi:DNA-binding NarL/FixJ family response regulator